MPAAPILSPRPADAPPAAVAGPLAARGLACRRGRRLLFRGLDLELSPGSVTWLRGRNGSGKTSLLRLLAGLSAPEAGEITWAGQPLRRAGLAARDGRLYLGHANALKDDLGLGEAVAFLAALAGLDRAPQRARAALERLGLAGRHDAPVRTLSQGLRRRGALARLALDDAPRAWLLDEPFDALDSDSVQRLGALIEAHRARGGAVLLTSHQPVALPALRELDLEAWRAS